jgi:hypothetical protein
MARADLRGKPQGYPIPTAHEAFALSDSATMPEDTVAVRVAVTAAGNLVYEDWGDVESTYHYPAAGVYVERGQFQRVKATGATATLSPATTVTCLRILT